MKKPQWMHLSNSLCLISAIDLTVYNRPTDRLIDFCKFFTGNLLTGNLLIEKPYKIWFF